MKVALGLLLLIGIGLFLMYQVGGYATLDPDQQGRDAQAAITPGMTVDQVFDAIGEPKQFSVVNLKTVERLGEEVEELVPAPRTKFIRDRFDRNRADGNYPHGYQFEYRHSPRTMFEVTFDASDTVTYVGTPAPGILSLNP